MSKLPVLSEVLPRLWSVALELQAELTYDTFPDWESLYRYLDFLTEQGWIAPIEMMIPGWQKIATEREGLTAKHTMVVLASCMNTPEYQTAEEDTQYEIEWAVIFHDIDKDIRFGRDASHGVRSAGIAAQDLSRLGFEMHEEKGFTAWVDLLMSAQKQVDGNWVNDFTHLSYIRSGLGYFFGVDTPASRIIKAVMFHQSLPTLDDWPNPIILSDDQIRASLTLADMEVLGPLMLGDSDAWNVCEPTRGEYMEELRGNIEKVRKIIE